MFRFLSTSYLALILGVPSIATGLLVRAASGTLLFWPALAAAPWLFLWVYVTTAGLLSRRHQRGVRPGRFRRDTSTPLYRDRRLYGLCWCTIYYFPTVLSLCLAIPSLKRWTLRLFGWRGSLDVTLYPDTWLRDLPVLEVGEGAYIANRSTIGTNIVQKAGFILVDAIRIGAGSVIGHLAKIGPGAKIGAGSEIGVGTAIGFRVVIGEDVVIGATTTVDHGAVVGDNARVGTSCYIGKKAVIEPGASVPPGTVVPARTVVRREPVESSEATRRVPQQRLASLPASVRHAG